jgi:NodT family efflux transporter outer membrane factor (OMF) lipoprotein
MIVATALTLVLLGGCAVTPTYESPPAPGQTRFLPEPKEAPAAIGSRETEAGDPGTAPNQEIVMGRDLPANWWTLFRSAQIDEVVHQALAGNQSLAAARARLAAARARIGVARAGLMPQVDGLATVQRTRFGAPILGPDAKDFPIFSAYAIGPSVSYDLDAFGGTQKRIEYREASAKEQAAQMNAATIMVDGNVVIEAVVIASLRSQIDVVERILADDQGSLDLIRAARHAGAVSDIDVLSAQSQLDHDRTLLPALNRQSHEAQDALALLVGQSPADWSAPEFDLNSLSLPGQLPVALPSEVVHRRPDIVAAEARLHAASAAVGIATANMYPHVTLSAAVGSEGLMSRGPTETAWNLLGGISVPIFHGGALRAERSAAQDDFRASAAEYRQTVLSAFGQVADTLQALSTDTDALNAQRRALESASASLELTQKGYRAGNAGYLQVLDARRLEQEAQLGEVQARAQRYLDSVKLVLALGG